MIKDYSRPHFTFFFGSFQKKAEKWCQRNTDKWVRRTRRESCAWCGGVAEGIAAWRQVPTQRRQGDAAVRLHRNAPAQWRAGGGALNRHPRNFALQLISLLSMPSIRLHTHTHTMRQELQLQSFPAAKTCDLKILNMVWLLVPHVVVPASQKHPTFWDFHVIQTWTCTEWRDFMAENTLLLTDIESPWGESPHPTSHKLTVHQWCGERASLN